MLTIRAAAALLSNASSVGGLAEALRAAGLVAVTEALDLESRERLGIEAAQEAQLGAATGAVRCLLIQLGEPTTFRDSLQRLVPRLSTRAPHVLWLVAAIDQHGEAAALCGVTSGSRHAGIASFFWEPSRVMNSDAETLCALSGVRCDDDSLFYSRCIDVLGRDALTRRFYRGLETQVTAMAESAPGRSSREDSRAIALLYASRLLFLCFLEAKGWLDGDRAFIANQFDATMARGGAYHKRVLLPLFFGTLNTPGHRRAPAARAFGSIPFLNGGLFARTRIERCAGRFHYSDERLGALLDLFHRFRFVAREGSVTWSEAAVDPEMLGRAFESLMAPPDRKAGGVFYTPHPLVRRVAEEALTASVEPQASNGLASLKQIRVLDPACGSGAFLVYALECIAERRQRLGDSASIASIRRDVLARSVFGVDRDPTAVWLCELRLWLSVVIESDETNPLRVPPLPNLDRNIRVGDALVGHAFAAGRIAMEGSRRVVQLRSRYLRATGARKGTLARTLDREERRRALLGIEREIDAVQHARREHLAVLRARDLFGQRVIHAPHAQRESKRLRDLLHAARRERRRVQDGGAPTFSFGALFAEAQSAGGFDVVLGNPPWVRLHRIPGALRLLFKQTYQVFRAAPWRSGAASAGVATGFASQVDLAALFVERSVALLRPSGVVALLLPVKLWHSLAGGGVRQFLSERAPVLRLEDLSESKHAFDAAAYPSLLVARKGEPTRASVALALHARAAYREWRIPRLALPLDDSPGAPWILLPPAARTAFDRFREVGTALATSDFGPPRLGVKSGCNVAFIVRAEDTTRDVACVVDGDGERGKVELSLLRPALRGDAVTPWARQHCAESIIWTHDELGPVQRLPPHARAWLRRRYDALSSRADAARARRWWSLFRTDAGDSGSPRVVWADIGRRPRALVLPANDPAVPLNTCYVLRCEDECDAWALAAILNSPVAAAWLNALAEPARGGYRRYMGWTVGQLPLPRDWRGARAPLAAAGRECHRESSNSECEGRLHDAVLSAYGLGRGDVAALLDHR